MTTIPRADGPFRTMTRIRTRSSHIGRLWGLRARLRCTRAAEHRADELNDALDRSQANPAKLWFALIPSNFGMAKASASRMLAEAIVSGAKPRANMKRLPTNAKPLLKICFLHQQFSKNDQQWRLFLCMCVPGVLPHLQAIWVCTNLNLRAQADV